VKLRHLSVLTCLLLCAGLLVSCSGFPDEFPAADFTLPDIFGGPPISLSDYEGRPVILYWLTSW